jgi:hypothetical protein
MTAANNVPVVQVTPDSVVQSVTVDADSAFAAMLAGSDEQGLNSTYRPVSGVRFRVYSLGFRV